MICGNSFYQICSYHYLFLQIRVIIFCALNDTFIPLWDNHSEVILKTMKLINHCNKIYVHPTWIHSKKMLSVLYLMVWTLLQYLIHEDVWDRILNQGIIYKLKEVNHFVLHGNNLIMNLKWYFKPVNVSKYVIGYIKLVISSLPQSRKWLSVIYHSFVSVFWAAVNYWYPSANDHTIIKMQAAFRIIINRSLILIIMH